MLTEHQTEIMARFLTMPPSPYEEIIAAEVEAEELRDEVESLKSDISGLEDDARDNERELDAETARVNELEAALADALSWVAEPLGGIDAAQSNREFARLWGIL